MDESPRDKVGRELHEIARAAGSRYWHELHEEEQAGFRRLAEQIIDEREERQKYREVALSVVNAGEIDDGTRSSPMLKAEPFFDVYVEACEALGITTVFNPTGKDSA